MSLFNLLVLIAVVIFSIYLRKNAPLGVFVRDHLNAAVDRVHASGSSETVVFHTVEDNLVVLCPPYSSPGTVENPFSAQLIRALESHCLTGDETGHLMLVQHEKIRDHRTLSMLAEPILGWTRGPVVRFEISKTQTSGRPVRIEIKKS